MKGFIPKTCHKCVADTIQFFPFKFDFPALLLNEHLLNVLDTITTILHQQQIQCNNHPFNILQTNIGEQPPKQVLIRLHTLYGDVFQLFSTIVSFD